MKNTIWKDSFNKKELFELLEIKCMWDLDGQIIHNDLDGIISGLLVKKYLGLELNGICNINSQLNMQSYIFTATPQTKEIQSKLFVDVSAIHPKLTCLDHHWAPDMFRHGTYYNCNKFIKNSDFNVKNPTGLCLFLCYLFNVDIADMTDDQKLLLCMADSFHEVYYGHFQNNCRNWLRSMDQECLIDFLEYTGKNKVLEMASQLKNYIGIIGNGFQRWEPGMDHVEGLWVSHNAAATPTQTVIDNIAMILGLETLLIPDDMNYAIPLDNFILPYSQDSFDEIKKNKFALTSAVRSQYKGIYVSQMAGKAIKYKEVF